MNLNVRPILSALLRNRTGAVLVAMQIAIALAVLVNALYIVMQRIEKMRLPTGIDVDNVLVAPLYSTMLLLNWLLKYTLPSGPTVIPAGPCKVA